jgi:hypothetical protein
MNRTIIWKLASAVLPITAIALAYSHEAEAQLVGPPPAYVASYEPIYYNGHAHYLYRDRWLYRDHAAWRGYDHEPWLSPRSPG